MTDWILCLSFLFSFSVRTFQKKFNFFPMPNTHMEHIPLNCDESLFDAKCNDQFYLYMHNELRKKNPK